MTLRSLSALAACAAAGLAPFGAGADDSRGSGIDWKIEAQLSETLEYDSNALLDEDSDGGIYGSTTRIGLTTRARTKTSEGRLSTGFSGAVFGGSSDADGRSRNRIDPNITGSYSFGRRTWSFGVTGAFSLRPASVAQLEDAGATERDATQLNASAGAQFTIVADPLNSLTVGANASIIDFTRRGGNAATGDDNDPTTRDSDSLTPSRTFGVTGGWSHRATETTSLSFNTGYRYFEADNDENTRSDAVDLTVGMAHQRTSRHRVNLSGGLSGVFSKDDSGRDFNLGFNGGALLAYDGGIWDASLNLTQDISASNEGELSAFTRLSGDIGYQWNRANSLSLNALAVRRSDVGGGGDVSHFFSLGPTLTHSLTRRSNLSLGYAFRMDESETESLQTGHRVFLTLSTGLDLLP